MVVSILDWFSGKKRKEPYKIIDEMIDHKLPILLQFQIETINEGYEIGIEYSKN